MRLFHCRTLDGIVWVQEHKLLVLFCLILLCISQLALLHPFKLVVVDVYAKATDSVPTADDICVLPFLDPWRDDILPFLFVDMNANPVKTCNKKFAPLTKLKDFKVKCNNFKQCSERCEARCLRRDNDFYNAHGAWTKVGVVMACDVVQARCKNANGTVYYDILHAQVFVNKSNSAPAPTARKRPSRTSVYVILLDSISATQASRSIPKTLSYFEKSMRAVSLPHLNRVAENSGPNSIALWFGKLVQRVDRSMFKGISMESEISKSDRCARFLDNQTFLFKEFADVGYKTLLAEDWAQGALNYPDCLGFLEQPCDHYMRPYQVHFEWEASKTLKTTMDPVKNCVEHHKALLEYLRQFIHSYPGEAKFGWIWLVNLGHGSQNGLAHADGDLHRFLMDNRKQLDESFVFLMADHGLRFGDSVRTPLGAREANNPMLSVSLPTPLRNSAFRRQLVDNSLHLQTHFDVRETLRDILYVKNQPTLVAQNRVPSGGQHGSSLLRPSPMPRTCRSLPIPFEYCLCDRPSKALSKSSDEARSAAAAVLTAIATKLTKASALSRCEPLALKKIVSFKQFTNISESFTTEITLLTEPPSSALFTATAAKIDGYGGFQVVSSIQRLNAYGSNGGCVGPNLEKYCSCKHKPTR